MALTLGTRLGAYDITAQIGEGGMGQVWRARDTKLNRDVALKVLPDSFANDADRLARFTREAQTLAALNHPNIAQIYGLEESGGVRALVMELVEGEDLSQRLVRGAIPLDEALPIAKQIAEALEAAHEQGIIHRDLKPANIKVRADGTVKVLDFGLAKAMDQGSGIGDQGSGGAANSPTITTPAMTQAGMILGTAAYMSPEQAKGRPVDRRADLWALGAVSYEMLTGQRAFTGEDVTDTMVSVLSKEPDWSALPAKTPATIRKLLRRCLEKDRKRRLDSAADARLEVEEALAAPGADSAEVIRPTARARLLPWALVATLGVMLAAALLLWAPWRAALVPPEMRLDIATPATEDLTGFALSPDGRQVVFAASGDGAPRLWLRSLATTTAQPLAGTESGSYPFWSPDGRSIGFFADGKLKRLDLGAGTPQTLATAVPRGGSWNADGVILFTPNTGSPLFRVPASGGQAVAVTTLVRQASHRFPSFLPDGRHFLFLAQGAPDTSGIYLGSLDSPATGRLTETNAGGTYLPSGWLLWARNGNLVAQRLDVEHQSLTGEPAILADTVVSDRASGVGDGPASVSASGLVAYRTGVGSRRQLTWFDRSGKSLGAIAEAREEAFLGPSVSPDGHRVAAYLRDAERNVDVWILDGTRTTRFTFDTALDRFPIWSADGHRVVFESNRKGHRDLYVKSSSGTGAEELLVESQQDKLPTDRSSDGRLILYQSTDPQTDRDLWVLPLDGDRTPRVLLKTPFSERQGAFSPDARWVAYISNESGRDEVYIRPVAAPTEARAADGADGQWQVSTAGGVFPRWRADGKELYYLRPNGDMMAAPIAVTGTTLVPGAPVALFPSHISGGGVDNQQGRQYDVAPDGRFLINAVTDEAAAPITLLMNWNPEAKK